MELTLRGYLPQDFGALHKLDLACFPPGVSYSKTILRHFLGLNSADCALALDGQKIIGFILSDENPPLAHIISLDVAETHRRQGVGSALLGKLESNLAKRGVRTILLETSIESEAAIAFWKRHGYRIEAVLKRYYLGRIDAYEMRKLMPAAAKAASAQKET